MRQAQFESMRQALLLVCGALILTACGGHLTRTMAKAQLDELAKQAQRQDLGAPHSILASIGTVANCEPISYSSTYDPVESSDSTAVLSATGYMTVRPIKAHVWDVELTEIGNQSVAGEKYGHDQKGECNQWQVTIPLANYDHLDITGIVEEGVQARVDASFTFIITPVGMAARKVATPLEFGILKKMFGESFAKRFQDDYVKRLLGEDLVRTEPDKDRYIKKATFKFDKYDDGWKVLDGP